MAIMRSITLTNAKETITCAVNQTMARVLYKQTKSLQDFVLWLFSFNTAGNMPFNRGIKQNKITLGTARSWLLL